MAEFLQDPYALLDNSSQAAVINTSAGNATSQATSHVKLVSISYTIVKQLGIKSSFCLRNALHNETGLIHLQLLDHHLITARHLQTR